MSIGRFYLKRGECNAAINRFRSVIKPWKTTSQVLEALERPGRGLYRASG